MTTEVQGKKERVSAAVTAAEKAALSWLGSQEPDGVSGLLRRVSISEALKIAADLRAKLGRAA